MKEYYYIMTINGDKLTILHEENLEKHFLRYVEKNWHYGAGLDQYFNNVDEVLNEWKRTNREGLHPDGAWGRFADFGYVLKREFND